MTEPLDLIARLLAAIAEAHTPRAFARSIATTLAARVPVTYVAIEGAAVELVAGDWRPVEVPSGSAQSVVPGLTLGVRGALPSFFGDPAFKSALGAVIDAGLRHVGVVQRVAQLSRRAHHEARTLRGRLGEMPAIVARSAAMHDLLARAELVARHSTTVLITGESGTGKELLAHEIHRRSARAHRPLVTINCGAIPPALVESELFGYERGAFTGADRRHIGVFERAHRGTLFLDEIGELPLPAQVKLLRVLQDGTFRRVGGSEEITSDVRLIAATLRSLPALVSDGTFREDLFYRINVLSLAVPPLRERQEDIAPLVIALLDQLAARLGAPVPTVPTPVMARLQAYAWPGNVRELANVLEAALILGDGDTLAVPAALSARRPTRAATFDATVADTIEGALRATRGKIYGADGAAARLGLKPATLQSKMRKLGIERQAFTR